MRLTRHPTWLADMAVTVQQFALTTSPDPARPATLPSPPSADRADLPAPEGLGHAHALVP